MKPSRNQFTLRLTDELNETLSKNSDKLGISKNAYILMVLTNDVKKAV